MSNNFVKFPSIEHFSSFHHRLKKTTFTNDRPVVIYDAKVKLHGTNAAVNISEGVVVAQKRTSILNYPSEDNAGFAAWLEEHKEEFKNLPNMIIYGEWAGQGIQKGDAICRINRKSFFVFSILWESGTWFTSPDAISAIMPNVPDMFVIPWFRTGLRVDLSRENSITEFLDIVNSMVEKMETEDPYVKDTFGISHPGEGFVFYPNNQNTDFMFKAKTERHTNNKGEKSAAVDPILHTNAFAFAEEFVTDARISQALSEAGIRISDATQRDTGALLKWIGQDIKKESEASLDVAGMDWKSVAKAVNETARRKFFELLEGRI